MMLRHLFIALGALTALSAAAQENPPVPPPAEQKEAEQKPADKKPADKQEPARKKTAQDRLDLDSTSITGNRELPKVLYIVPWKKSGMGDLPGRPTNSLLDEVLAPVDRDVFRRQTEYFSALDAQGKTEPKSAPPPSEKPSAK